VQNVKAEAISSLEELGLHVKDKDGNWLNLTVKVASIKKEEGKDDDNDDDNYEERQPQNKAIESNCAEAVIQSDITNLQSIGLIDNDLADLSMNKISSLSFHQTRSHIHSSTTLIKKPF